MKEGEKEPGVRAQPHLEGQMPSRAYLPEKECLQQASPVLLFADRDLPWETLDRRTPTADLAL